MAKGSNRKKHRGTKGSAQAPDVAPHRASAGTSQAAAVSRARIVAGTVFLAISVASGAMLVLDHFSALSLPGCGEGGGCAEAAASVWGTVPGIEWPVSFLGLAYFLGALVAWACSTRGVTSALRNIVRLGALISLCFVAIIFIEKHICYYCLAAHAGNLAFWIVVEKSRKATAATWRPIVSLALVFIVASATMGVTKLLEAKRVQADLDRQVDESVDEIITASTEKAASVAENESVASSTGVQDLPAIQPDAASEKEAEATPIESADESLFTGRYRWGPEKAPIRIVMITDYQCSDCQAVEVKLREIMERREDISVSIKHSPMDTSCNDHVSRTLHANACWAARAAEAAGMLRGVEGFWEMHHWLFDHGGTFTKESLQEGLLELGYEPQEFIELMSGEITEDLVKADTNEAHELGVFFTPMIFINGKQLRGVFEQNAGKLTQAVERLAAANLPPMTAAADHPPNAVEKSIGDWREKRFSRLPPDTRTWPRGPDDAKVKIVMWSDYQEKYTVRADRIIRTWIQGRPDVQYTFRHFPFNQDCNPSVNVNFHPLACRASMAAEAAGTLGGVEGYWKMHDWLMDHQKEFNDPALRQAATKMGFDPAALFKTMEAPEIAAAITEDCKAARPSKEAKFSRLFRNGIPTIYLNGKVIPRWRLGEEVILEQILDAAYAE